MVCLKQGGQAGRSSPDFFAERFCPPFNSKIVAALPLRRSVYRAHATQPTVPSAKRSQGAPVVRRCSARVGGSGAALRVAHPHTHVLAPMIDRSILREVKSGPYMLKAGFQKGSMELRTCPLDVSPLACVSDLPWRLVAAQHPPPYPEALKFHVKCNFMNVHEISTH